MNLINHLGVFAFILLFFYIVYFFEQDWENGHPWYIPLGAGALIWGIFEAFYWLIRFFFILN